ncbi:MAG TPA: 50S ribosomal protein L17 [Bacteroidota bacterium]|nr:50S ribosomal protein L17 [Bacteroidota bacterium]
MRHRKSGRKLKRTASHRRATLAALSTALLRHKRITTTVAKAKETRMLVEKLITRARNAAAKTDAPATGVHARRQVGRLIKDREVIGELFSTIAAKVAGRAGGYTRIVKLGQRLGDGAEMAVIELVDFNAGQEPAEKKAAAPKARKQARRAPSKKKAAAPAAAEGSASSKKEAAPDAGAQGSH